MAAKTDRFGSIPFRAFADRRLSGFDVTVLGIIAAHDNRSLVRGVGDGCFASIERIAKIAGAHYHSVVRAISGLIKLGYLVRGPHPKDGRRSTFRVVYTDADNAAFDGEIFSESVSPTGEINRESVEPQGYINPEVCNPTVTYPAKVCNRANPKAEQNQAHNFPKRPLEKRHKGKEREETLKRGSAEAAPVGTGASLGRLEKRLKKNPAAATAEAREFLEETIQSEQFDELGGWARRLLEEFFDDEAPDQEPGDDQSMRGRTEA